MYEFVFWIYICTGLLLSIPLIRYQVRSSEEVSEDFSGAYYAVDVLSSLFICPLAWPVIVLIFIVKNSKKILNYRIF